MIGIVPTPARARGPATALKVKARVRHASHAPAFYKAGMRRSLMAFDAKDERHRDTALRRLI
jgi:hypothetical protein